MPTAIKSKAKKEKIVNYFADGTRETVGYLSLSYNDQQIVSMFNSQDVSLG